MHFMSIEAAAHDFLFEPSVRSSVASSSSSNFDQLLDAMKKRKVPEIPFFHNHLHDLESLWWVAVWVIFYNNFSEPEPSFTFQDAQLRLGLARKLFPHTLDSMTRQNGFKIPSSFRKICKTLPHNKEDIYNSLDLLREFLIDHYEAVEKGYPQSIDLDASKEDIYDVFTLGFSKLQTLSDGLVLHFVPEIYSRLLKRPRSESTNDTGAGQQKSARKY